MSDQTERAATPIEALPCPFCGHVGLDFQEGSTFRWLAYSCGGCGMGTETRVQTMGEGSREGWLARAEQDAIEEWNTRAQPAAEPVDESRLRATDRADVWAEEFAKVMPTADRGLMIGWFANCAENAKDLERRKREATHPAPAAEPLSDALDAKRLDWIECNVMNGKLEIAQSIFKTGYEFGFWQQDGPRAIVKTGTLRAAIDAAIAAEEKQ